MGLDFKDAPILVYTLSAMRSNRQVARNLVASGLYRAVARLYNVLYVLQIGQHLAGIGGGLTWVRSIVCHRLQSIRSIQTLDRIHDFYEEVGTIIRV